MAGLWCAFSANSVPAEQYSFDVEAYENKSVQWGGYAEIKSERLNLNTDAALYKLAFDEDPHGGINRTSGALQLEMGYSRNMAAFRGVFNTQSVLDELDWSQRADIYEANLSLKPTPSATFEIGKKVHKWGKGYAWNPLGFIDRPKDPTTRRNLGGLYRDRRRPDQEQRRGPADGCLYRRGATGPGRRQ